MGSKALGKGLSALIPDREQEEVKATAQIETQLIRDNQYQPRTNYDDGKLNELKESIRQKGMLQPILIRETTEGYEVVAGERRLKAARALNLNTVPAIVKNVTDQEALIIALIENIQREELNPIEEAEAYRKLIEDFDLTHESVSQAVGKERSTVSNLLRLLKLPEEIKKGVYSEEISFGHARALLSVDSAAQQKHFFALVTKKQLSVRELENLIKSQGPQAKRRERKSDIRDPRIAAFEDNLQKIMGTKVRLFPNKKRGKIVIEYYSLEDLTRIIQLIIKK